MLRVTNLRLPLDHDEAALRAAIVARLRIRDAELRDFIVHKKSWDARKKSAVVAIGRMQWDVKIDELIPQLIRSPEVAEESREKPRAGVTKPGHGLDDFLDEP